jgi:carbonic anhydrase
MCGPNDWSKVDSRCGQQGTQSPIDAIFSTATRLADASTADLTMAGLMSCSQADFLVNRHTTEVEIEYTCPSAFVVSWKGKTFELLGYHYHSPSEHTVDGKHYPMEVHHVHRADDGQYLVLAVFIDADANLAEDCEGVNLPSDQCSRAHFFENILKNMPKPPYTGPGAEETGVTFEADPYTQFIPPMDKHFYYYNGSFTTPGCATDVVWILNPTPVKIFESSLLVYRQMINMVPNNQLAVKANFTVYSGGQSALGSQFFWNTSLGVNNRPIQPLVGPGNLTRLLYKVEAVEGAPASPGDGRTWDSSASSSGSSDSSGSESFGQSGTSLDFGLSSSASWESDVSDSENSSGSNASGSSGFYMAMWKWFVVALCLLGCLGAACVAASKRKKKKLPRHPLKQSSRDMAVATPAAPANDAGGVAQPLLPYPAMPLDYAAGGGLPMGMAPLQMVATPGPYDMYAQPAYGYAQPGYGYAQPGYAQPGYNPYAQPGGTAYMGY